MLRSSMQSKGQHATGDQAPAVYVDHLCAIAKYIQGQMPETLPLRIYLKEVS